MLAKRRVDATGSLQDTARRVDWLAASVDAVVASADLERFLVKATR